MFKIVLGNGQPKQQNGLEGFDMENALKKIPVKDLSIMTFKQLNDHMMVCAKTAEMNLKVLKFVGWLVGALVLEKLNEMFHLVQHIPTLPGG